MRRPIGVIDSGVGGLTVAKEIMNLLPKENLIYFGDTARVPYGPRSEQEIIQFTLEIVDYLLLQNIKALVIACNTITAYTINLLREKLSIPVIGVIKAGARTALRETKSKHIAVIATEATIQSQAYEKHLSAADQEVKTRGLACPLFVPYVEKGIFDGEEIEAVVRTSLTEIKDSPTIDSIILGCTHFPLLEKTIQKTVGDSIKLISPSKETARDLKLVLRERELLNRQKGHPNYSLITTGDLKSFKNLIEKILPNLRTSHKKVKVQRLSLMNIN